MKKKVLSLVLSLALCLGLAVPALAAEAKPHSISDDDAGAAVAISDVYYSETVSVEMDGNEMDEDYYEGQRVVNEITVYHVKEGASITITNNGEPLSFADGECTYYTESWPLSKTDAGWSAGELETFQGEDSDLGSWGTGESLNVSEISGNPVAMDGRLTLFTLGVRRKIMEGPRKGYPNVRHIRVFCVFGEEPMADGPSDSQPSGDVNFRFTDVKPGDWFYEAVQWAVEEKITTGTADDTFSPGQNCVNAQILTFLWRAKGSPEPNGAPASGEYYAKALQWAAEQGIAEKTLDPNAPCTRAMAVEYLWKAAGSPENDGKTAFADVKEGTDLAKAAAWALERGVTEGTSKTAFSPDQVCTRGHIVTFLYRDLTNSAGEQNEQKAQGVDITKAVGTYRRDRYELDLSFYSPKAGVVLRNTKYNAVILTGGLTISGNHAFTSDGISVYAYPGYIMLELSNQFESSNELYGGRYDFVS